MKLFLFLLFIVIVVIATASFVNGLYYIGILWSVIFIILFLLVGCINILINDE